ncbi:MAG: phenylacetic acid degradation protein, partial [Chitinophagaceae bacterium]
MALQKLRVISVSKQPTEVIKIEFETLNEEELSYKAGQFLTFVFHVHGKDIRRSYSFCSSPDVDEPIAIAVKL